MQFLFGLIGGFLGGLAFGPINLSVVDITLKKGVRAAISFCAAAAMAELIHSTAALLFGKIISRKIDELPELKLLVIIFFVILGVYFILKKDNTKVEISEDSKRSNFLNGFIIAILNPQTIPYWIFVLAYLKSSTNHIDLKSWYILFLLAGAAVGKFFILGSYAYLSKYIENRTNNLRAYVSNAIGGLLLAVGVFQVIKYFFYP